MITTEKILPAFNHIIKELMGECLTQDTFECRNACERLWLAIDALDRVTCCFKRGGEYAAIAISNEKQVVADFIEKRIGINPIIDETFVTWDQ